MTADGISSRPSKTRAWDEMWKALDHLSISDDKDIGEIIKSFVDTKHLTIDDIRRITWLVETVGRLVK